MIGFLRQSLFNVMLIVGTVILFPFIIISIIVTSLFGGEAMVYIPRYIIGRKRKNGKQ